MCTAGIFIEGLNEEVATFLLKAWRPGTRRQYDCYLKKWMFHCLAANINPYSPSNNQVLTFLYDCYKAGLGYSALGTIRSALSKIIHINQAPVGQHFLVSQFMKAVYQERPVLAKNSVTWDINDALNYLKSLGPCENLSMEMLTKKTASYGHSIWSKRPNITCSIYCVDEQVP